MYLDKHPLFTRISNWIIKDVRCGAIFFDDDDVYLINYNMAVGYKIYLHTNIRTSQNGISRK
jgi:hypothetical protein